MTNTSTSKTITKLRLLFAQHGIPEQVVSDNGPQFTSEEFAHFMKQNHIKHTRCAPYHPSSNGLVERFNQTLKQSLRASEKDGRSLAHRICDFLLTYRSTPHVTTNHSPASLMFHRELRTRFTLLQPHLAEKVRMKQMKQTEQRDQHTKSCSFQVERFAIFTLTVRNGSLDKLSTNLDHSPTLFVLSMDKNGNVMLITFERTFLQLADS